ncbi:MAG: FMN-binding protein [Gemmatimonadetes bacterium]|nr:FMN-binding protein [Gemmatimonadota bacterium]
MTAPASGRAQILLTQDEALRLAFPPPTEIQRSTAFLTEEQVQQARSLAGEDVEVKERVVTYYVGVRDGRAVGVAYFDVHRVRTLPEVVMFVLSPDERIERIEILRFQEPPEYRAPAGWLDQFEGRPLDENLSVKRGIVNITGATLTARAVTRAARRVLALHRVIDPLGSREARGKP